MKQTLTYIRVAKKAKDGYDGFLYIHHFGTGWQYLIFGSHEAAEKFKESMAERFEQSM